MTVLAVGPGLDIVLKIKKIMNFLYLASYDIIMTTRHSWTLECSVTRLLIVKSVSHLLSQ